MTAATNSVKHFKPDFHFHSPFQLHLHFPSLLPSSDTLLFLSFTPVLTQEREVIARFPLRFFIIKYLT